MSNLEIITADNSERIRQIGPKLAATYKVAFAGDPWYEVSKCAVSSCLGEFSDQEPGSSCAACGSTLVEAYNSEELIDSWANMLEKEDAWVEVTLDNGLAQRATIARPTNAEELAIRKYANVPAMGSWLKDRFNSDFVWIEDTFADRVRKPSGNLSDRGRTLGKIATYYGGAQILTRTLSPAIVSATLRDCRSTTVAYVGTNGVGEVEISRSLDNPSCELLTAPDRRTLLVINNKAKGI